MSNNNGNVRAQTFNLSNLPADFGMQQPLLMRLDIYPEAVLRTVYTADQDGHPVASDEVSPFDVAAALAGLDTGTGILPERVLFYRQAGPEYHIGVYLPPEPRLLHVTDGEAILEFAVPCPPLVFAGRGTAYHVYALGADGWPDARARLYQAPFPNVHTGGNICAGNVQFPACAPDIIHAAAKLFFESGFSQHLRNAKSRTHEHNVLALYRGLAGAESYPLDDLIGLDKRLGDLVKE